MSAYHHNFGGCDRFDLRDFVRAGTISDTIITPWGEEDVFATVWQDLDTRHVDNGTADIWKQGIEEWWIGKSTGEDGKKSSYVGHREMVTTEKMTFGPNGSDFDGDDTIRFVRTFDYTSDERIGHNGRLTEVRSDHFIDKTVYTGRAFEEGGEVYFTGKKVTVSDGETFVEIVDHELAEYSLDLYSTEKMDFFFA